MQTLDEVYGYDLEANKTFSPYLKAIRHVIKTWDVMNTVSFNAKITQREMKQLVSACLNRVNQMMETESHPGHHTGYDPDSTMNLYDPDVKTNSYAKLKHMYKYDHTHVPIAKSEAYCSKYNLVKQPLAMIKLALYRSHSHELVWDHGSEIMDLCKQYTPMNDFVPMINMPTY